MSRKIVPVFCVLLLAGSSAFAQLLISKPPDLGPFWQPLSPNGTYVYSDSFFNSSPEPMTPTVLGTWLQTTAVPPPNVRFEVWGEAAGGGPDASAVLATTGSLSLPVTATLAFFSAPVIGTPSALAAGQRYWFVATCVGEAGTGDFVTGGHTQNSVYADNGTFWYSNDPAGVSFDGQNNTPEMAFEVTLDQLTGVNIPTAGPWGIALLIAMVALAGALLIKRL
jgi:hypothetical protein